MEVELEPDVRRECEALEGEIHMALAEWTNEYELQGLELAWAVMAVLKRHVQRQVPGRYVEFVRTMSRVTGEENALIKDAQEKRQRLKIN